MKRPTRSIPILFKTVEFKTRAFKTSFILMAIVFLVSLSFQQDSHPGNDWLAYGFEFLELLPLFLV